MSTRQPGGLDKATDLLLVTNRAITTLTSAITGGSSSFTVADGSDFPASSFLVTIDDEILRISGNILNTFSIATRGEEGTIIASHPVSKVCANQFTKGTYETVRNAIIATQEGYMRRPTTETPPGGLSKFGEDVLEDVRRFAL